MINTTVENIIEYEVYMLGDGYVLQKTDSRLKAYEYYLNAIKHHAFKTGLRRIVINTTIEILEGE